MKKLLELFQTAKGRTHRGLLALFLAINLLALANVMLHDPRVGYDASEHLDYIRALARGHLPTFAEAGFQSFTPPLSSVVPSLVLRLMALTTGDQTVFTTDSNLTNPDSGGGRRWLVLGITAKSAQLLNWFCSFGLIIFLLKICELLKPRAAGFKIWTLLILGTLPVYYKTISFVRAEPLGGFLVVVSVYYFLRILLLHEFHRREAIMFGAALGLAILSRQWSFLIIPAFAGSLLLTWRLRNGTENKGLARSLAISLMATVLVSGWFYVFYPWHAAKPGQFRSYVDTVSMPVNGYTDTQGNKYGSQVTNLTLRVSPANLFSRPVRDSLADEAVSIFYSDLWGDYWGYFVTSRTAQSTTMMHYLGRVNLVSLLPAALLAAGLVFGFYQVFAIARSSLKRCPAEPRDAIAFSLITLLVASTLAGFVYFLLVMPNNDHGTSVKATYMFQIFPFLALLVGATIERVRAKSLSLYRTVLVLLISVSLHNVPAMFTHYFVTTGRPRLGW